ncbi:hypothetical protein Pint_34696 [Pistacia integerrima]|uniref:Uncharacterized protein n=1 Tax=Pistacia integerrima TaxID=434235 RepID=A0ACC0X814_9ROSI|nr:hypothetical protein Pint_34696 [Pistacia integerrima]
MLCSWKGCFAVEIVEIAVEVLKLLVVEVLKLLFVLNIEMVEIAVEALKLLVVEVLKLLFVLNVEVVHRNVEKLFTESVKAAVKWFTEVLKLLLSGSVLKVLFY